MNLTELERKLIAAARRHPPAASVPYAFEKRIMARLGSRPVVDEVALWANGLWRAAAACFAIAMLLGAFSVLDSTNGVAANNDLSEDFESIMLPDVNPESEL